MDPDATLSAIRDALTTINGTNDTWTLAMASRELADHVEALDVWLSKGGFRPADWMQPCPNCDGTF